MEKRELKKTKIKLSILGVGCWAFGGGDYWGEQAQKDVEAVVHEALNHGINYFDTAEAYNDGASEKSLGMALKGRRKEAIIGSKISPSNTEPSVLREHCEVSLRRLKTDYIDIYMLHWPLNPRSIRHFTEDEEIISSPPSLNVVYEELLNLKKEGKIREIGLSNFGVEQMKEFEEKGGEFVVNELPYNLLSRAIEDSILPYCKEHDIGIIGYMALQQGLLAGIYPDPDSVPQMQAHSRHFHHKRGQGKSRHGEEGAEKEVFKAISGVKGVAEELGLHIAQLSLAWAMSREELTCTLVGSRNLKELQANIKAVSLGINSEITEKLNKITEPVLKKLGTNPDYYENRNKSRIK